MRALPRLIVIATLAAGLVGCLRNSGPSTAGKNYLLEFEPQNAMGVVELKNALSSDSPPTGEMVVLGRVGAGDQDVFDQEQASFLLRDMDLEISPQDHDGHSDNCKFCQDKKEQALKSMALVRIVNDSGNVVSLSAESLLGLVKDQVVVAQGIGSVDEVGTFVFDASKVFVRP